MKRLPDNIHGAGADSVYETEPFGTSVNEFDAPKVATHLEAQGFGNFMTSPPVAGVSVYKPLNMGGKYCVRINYYDTRVLTDTEMATLETAIKATPEGA
jgi:hypothetical protein